MKQIGMMGQTKVIHSTANLIYYISIIIIIIVLYIDTHMPITIAPQGHSTTPVTCLSNKLSRLTLATFDEDGNCIGQMGSWTFEY